MRRFVLAGVLMCVANSANAQSSGDSTVNTQVRAAEAAFASVGYSKVMGTGAKSLNDDGIDNFTMNLNAGTRYAVLGACDADCRDLDLKVYGPNGQQLASDVATDDLPTIAFTPTQSGSHRLEVKMFNCTVNPCFYSASIVAGGGNAGPVNLATNTQSTSNTSNRWDAQVNAQLDVAEGTARGLGQTRLFRSPIFRLNEGANQSYSVSMVRGLNYTIAGVCDNDCPDLDIKLIDPNGNEVTADTKVDSAPVVAHTAQMNGTYQVRVIMYDCNAGPCSAGLTVMASGSGNVNNTNAATQWDAQVNAQLDRFEGNQTNAVRLFRSPIFRLNEGANQDYPVTLVGGVPYKIGGVCDNDCPDLDIQLLDPNGNVVERDALTDSLPIVNFTPRNGGRYRVRVIMYDCNSGPCSAGVTVMAGN